MRSKSLSVKAMLLSLLTAMLLFAPPLAWADEATSDMYRLYNPNSGEHFYTANAGERDNLTSLGWNYEGVGWVAPAQGAPVYRLYNPNAGDHHYTMSAGEKDSLVKAGWNYEGVGWYSDTSQRVPLYRQYNPNAKAGSHNYTTNLGENDSLVSVGWRAEGIGWYAVAGGHSVSPSSSAASSSSNQGEQGQDQAQTVYVTASGKKFHRPGCATIKRSRTTALSRADAVARGYEPCKDCRP